MTPAAAAAPDLEVWAHPRSFADGADRQAEDLATAGVRMVRLAACYHAGRWLLTTSTPGDVVYLPDSTPLFAIDPTLYTAIRPVVEPPSWDGDGGQPSTSFAVAVAALRRAGLRVVAWVVALHNSPLATAHPDRAIQNVLGRSYRHALCPANPTVARYAAALVRDAGSQGVDGVDVEALGFMGWLHGSHHEKVGVRLDPVDVYLLSLCVCADCRGVLGAHGVDVDRLVHQAAGAVQQRVSEGVDEAVQGHVAERAAAAIGASDHRGVQGARAAIVHRLVTQVAAACPVPLDLRITSQDHEFAGKAAGDVGALAGAVDRVTVTSLVNEAGALDEDLRALARADVDPGRTAVGLSLAAQEPTATRAEGIVALARAAGVRAIVGYAYDLVPSRRISWVAGAVRAPRAVLP